MAIQTYYAQDLKELKERARRHVRRRVAVRFHPQEKVGIRVMINAMMGNTLIAPYVHPSEHTPDSEIWIPLEGRIGLVTFQPDGELDQFAVLSRRDAVYLEIPPGRYHTALVLRPEGRALLAEPDDFAAMHEISRGPYDPQTYKRFASWAPQESDGGWLADYIHTLAGKLELL